MMIRTISFTDNRGFSNILFLFFYFPNYFQKEFKINNI